MPHERDSAEMLGFCNKLPSASHCCVSLGLFSFCLEIPLALVSARPHTGSLLSLQSFLCLGLLCPGQSLVTAEEKKIKGQLALRMGLSASCVAVSPCPHAGRERPGQLGTDPSQAPETSNPRG